MPPKMYIPLAQRKNTTPKPSSGKEIDSIMQGLSHVESGGAYDALGAISPKTGDRAYGKYQFMGEYIPDWTQQYLGEELTPDDLLASPEKQEKLMRARAEDLYSRYGNADDVASVHFTGRPVKEAGMDVADYTGTSNASYLKKFHEGMGMTRPRYIPIAQRKSRQYTS